MVPVKFAGGLLATGGGLTLGREGPTACRWARGIGQMVSEVVSSVKTGDGERRALMSAGAGAGSSAAAFNAPLSGLIFVLEELHGELHAGDVRRGVPGVGDGRHRGPDADGRAAGVSPDRHGFARCGDAAVGGVAGRAGGRLPACCSTAACWRHSTCATALVRAPAFARRGGGRAWWSVSARLAPGRWRVRAAPLVQLAISGQIVLGALPLFIVARFALTMVSYGSGAAGGIFAPLLGHRRAGRPALRRGPARPAVAALPRAHAGDLLRPRHGRAVHRHRAGPADRHRAHDRDDRRPMPSCCRCW